MKKGNSPGPRAQTTPTRASPRNSALAAAKKAAMARRKAEGSSGDGGVVMPRDPLEPAREAKDTKRGKTGLLLDDRFQVHANPWDEDHIESPARVVRVQQRMRELDLVSRCQDLPSRLASDEELLRIHSEEHLRRLEEISENMTTKEQKEVMLKQFQSAFIGKGSEETARLAAGCAIDTATAVARGDVHNAMAVVRPPGHHAMKSEFNGFCLLNNVAAAARSVLDKQGVKRVLIVDFDVHHGQATQREFYEDERVLYFSIHRYEHGDFWPFLRESDYDFIGEKGGQGYNVNIPLNKTGTTDVDYLAAFHQVLLPLANEFDPELVLVSAGFDAAIGDREGEMSVSPQAYDHMVRSLMSLANGKVACILEGGYFLESLAESAALALRALLGDSALPLGQPLSEPSKQMQDTILNLLSALRPHWKSLQIQDTYDISTYDAETDQGCHEPSLVYKGEPHLVERSCNMEKYEPENFYGKWTAEQNEFFLNQLETEKKKYTHVLLQEEVKRKKKVALVYDLEMMRHSNMDEPGHPEQPKRVEKMFETIKEYGLMERPDLICVPSRRATKEEICAVHDEEYYEKTTAWPDLSQPELEDIGDTMDSIYLNPSSFDCALLSAGSLLNVVDAVCGGEAEKGAAVIRPPGHHAEAEEACGFCIFNNVAVAARHAIDQHGLKRVLVLDWDVHHGNGIQNMFYEDPRVLYISVHRFDYGTFFPGRPEAGHEFVGEGKGEGFNVNIPWNGSGMGDPEYLLALFNVILPIAYQFDPELVLVSAGFDAAFGDPLGQCKVSPHMYGHITHQLSNLAGGKVIVALEGGYNLTSISLSMTMCVKALLGDPLPPIAPAAPPKPSAIKSVRSTMESLSPFWSGLQFCTLKLPDNFPDLRAQMFERDETVTPRKEKKREISIPSSPYIPNQFGASANCSFVNTVSSTNKSNNEFVGGTTDSKYKDRTATTVAADLSEQIAALYVSTAGDSKEIYVPPQYLASRSVSQMTNTISLSSFGSSGGGMVMSSGSTARPVMRVGEGPKAEEKE